jgi:hypothetical protein
MTSDDEALLAGRWRGPGGEIVAIDLGHEPKRGSMRKILFLPVVLTAAVASFGSANAQRVFIDDPYVAGPVVTTPGPIVVPAAPIVSPDVVVIHRAPMVALAPVWVPRAPIAAESIVVPPPVCPYGYGYC